MTTMERAREALDKVLSMIDYTRVDDNDDIPDCIKDIIVALMDYDDALRLMVYQYCTTERSGNEVFDHEFMIAGETAFSVLGIDQGEEVPVGFDGIPW